MRQITHDTPSSKGSSTFLIQMIEQDGEIEFAGFRVWSITASYGFIRADSGKAQ